MFFRVQVFQGSGFLEPRLFSVQVFQGSGLGPGPGFRSSFWKVVMEKFS